VLGIYLFLFQELTEAQLRRDASRMDGVIRVLEEERTTWQELCAGSSSKQLQTASERISLEA